MKIGLIADTQVPSAELSPKIKVAFEGVDLILHAGDILIPSCLDYLEEIAPVMAVETGAERQFTGDSRVTEHDRVVEADGFTIGLVQELSIPHIKALEIVPGIIDSKFPSDASLPEAIAQIFGKPVDIVVYGFSHISLIEEHAGILFVNPGSATWPNQRVMPGTVAVLDLSPGSKNVRLVDLSKLD
jgi:putative phosphoesterase